MTTNHRFISVAIVALASVLASAGCAAPSVDDEESTEESQDKLLAGRRLSESEAATLIRNAGFPSNQVGRMLCTIKYESNFYERASNKNKNGSTDYGLFQINSIHMGDANCPKSTSGLYTAAQNAKCAYTVYKIQGNNAWYGYQKHRSECDRYAAPSAGSSDSDATSTDAQDTSSDGGCYSGTLEDMLDARACVQSKFDGIWYQCSQGKWYRGGSSGTGPFGACTSSHATE
ncbi:MAG: hypothetical protein JWP97_5532 [Labilithrix sp.]|nr:hypothetical protein [Labilithrix sp.]